ncbi:T9SS type A sorting domain-containing protein [Tamlana flava]|uniref:T9SS type A sorting domain-containing protein n=1 Tax=Tamlana flava TaxID=3158572 RepID=UPI00351AEC5A
MKKFTLLLSFLIASFGFSQDLLLGFEDGESGGFDGGVFGNGNALQVNLITDAGTNGTKVAEFIANSAGEIWQGINLNLTTDVDLTSTQTMTIDVKSATAITFLVKVNDGTGAEAAAAVTHNGDNTWQTLSFTFNTSLDGKAAMANGVYNGFVIHAYWAPGATAFAEVSADERTFYVDNISGPASSDTCSNGIQDGDETGVDCGGSCPNACPSPPTIAAPTPPARAATDVISLYSDAYTDVASNFDAGWCSAGSVAEVMIDGNPTIQYLNNPCQGIVLDAGVDASTFTYLHVDIYIQGGTDLTSSVFNLKFVQQPGGAALEVLLNIATSPALVAGSWLSVDVPVDLSTFDGFKEFGITSNLNSLVWYDNLYVHKNTTLSTDKFDLASFSLYPNPTQDSWTVKTKDIKMTSIQVFDVMGKEVLSIAPLKAEATIDGSRLKSGLYFAQISTETGAKSIKLIKQ